MPGVLSSLTMLHILSETLVQQQSLSILAGTKGNVVQAT